MAGTKLVYIAFLLIMLALSASIFLVPYLGSRGDSSFPLMQSAFAPTCHQLTSRSLCLFVSDSDGSYSIGDCLPEGEISYSRAAEVSYEGRTGYKMPVCSRDAAIYAAMLLGLLALPFLQRVESEEWPNKWILVAACIPIGIDGLTQLVGMRESSNLLRIITGGIVGIVLPFYILPILNSVHSLLAQKFKEETGGKEKGKKKAGKAV
jgi:uncharacterized membrane protein